MLDYSYNGRVESVELWAYDDEDARARAYQLQLTGSVRCKLADFVEAQNRYVPPVPEVVTENEYDTD